MSNEKDTLYWHHYVFVTILSPSLVSTAKLSITGMDRDGYVNE